MESSIILSMTNITSNELVIAIVGYMIVFAALLILYFLFNNLPRIIYLNFKWDMLRKGKTVKEPDEMIISGEEIAAISMALNLFFSELHDEESGILTIKKVSKTYSPWSSKIYAVRNQFNRI
jgi:glutaconyl-CoA/methylmalonyl-CoA decarboxylase subunit delta